MSRIGTRGKSNSRKTATGSAARRRRLVAERLERRIVLSTNVTTYLYDISQTGANTNETTLTPLNVNSSTFGLKVRVALDGLVNASPLYMENVNITSGTHQGVHNVVYVATEHDSLYAIDANSGTVLWQDSFIGNFLSGVTRLNPNVSGNVVVTSVPDADMNSTDIPPEVGIVSTPVIDTTTGTLYLTANTKEVINGNSTTPHYLWQLYAINISSGQLQTTIGSTTGPGVYTIAETAATNPGNVNTAVFTYISGPSVAGTGKGNVNGVVYFNSLRQMNRPALTLANGSIITAWASHGDNDPYHQWVLSFSASTLNLNGVFNGTPNGTEGGTWQSGGKVVVDSSGALYFETGNGTFGGINVGGSTPAVLNAQGFPADADYGDSVVKLVYSSTTAANPGPNGWGLTVADYFAPWNQQNIDNNDIDMASSGLLLLPDSAGNAQHPHLLLARGKTGVIYLIDRDNMGKYNPTTDNVVEEITNPTGFWSSPTYFNGDFYSTGQGDVSKEFSVNNAEFSVNPISSSTMTFGYPGATGIVSANGTANAILWEYDLPAGALRAFDATNLGTELWDSTQAAGNRDALGTVVKFTAPTEADGLVFAGTSNSLNIYGLLSTPNTAPNAPSNLSATSTTPGQVQLSLTRGATSSANYESDQEVYRSTDGTNFTLVGLAAAGKSTYTDSSGVQSGVTYYYKVRAVNAIGRSAFSNVITVQAIVGISGVWADADVGAPGAMGGVSFANNTLTVSGSGADVGESDDQFNFVYQPLTGNGTIVAKVLTQGNTNASAKAGVMIRNSLDPASAYAFAMVTPSSGITLQGRLTDGSSSVGSGTTVNGAAAPYWLKLVRTGSTIAGFASTDGVNYVSLGTLNVTLTNSTVYIGLAVTSHNNGVLSTATFNNVIVGAGNGLPGAPNSLSANLATGSQINLSWTDTATNDDGVKVMRKDPGSNNYHQVALLPARTSSFFDTGLTNGATYSYEIIASNTVGDSSPSNVVTVAIPTPPNTPSNLQVTSLTSTSASFSWQLSGTANNGVNIYRRDTTTSLYKLIATLPANTTTYTDTSGLTANTIHDYDVSSFNAGGFSASASVEIITPTLPPTGLAATGTHSSIQLSWTAPAGAATYNVFRGTSPGAENAMAYATGVSGTTFQDTAAVTGVTYYYYVTAQNAFTQGGDADSATLGPSAPSNEASGAFLGPTATVTPVSPNTVATFPNQMQIVFSEPVTGLTLSSLSLSAVGRTNILTSAQTLTTSDSITYTLGNLSALTAPGGTYTLKFTAAGSGVKDALNNPVVGDASASFVLNPTVPEVTGVYVRVSAWQPTVLNYLAANNLGSSLGYQLTGGPNQLLTLPWENIDTISVAFSRDVNVTQSSIQLIGSSSAPAAPSLSSAVYSYNSSTFTATWSFASPLALNKYLLSIPSSAVTSKATGSQLDGDVTTGVTVLPSGNGVAGGDFNFRFNILPGDTDQIATASQPVSQQEVTHILPHMLAAVTQANYDVYMDTLAKGRITGLDLSAVQAALGQTLPQNDPQPSGGGGGGQSLGSLVVLAGQTLTINSDGTMTLTQSSGSSQSSVGATAVAAASSAPAATSSASTSAGSAAARASGSSTTSVSATTAWATTPPTAPQPTPATTQTIGLTSLDYLFAELESAPTSPLSQLLMRRLRLLAQQL